jgi:hypothetical protein
MHPLRKIKISCRYSGAVIKRKNLTDMNTKSSSNKTNPHNLLIYKSNVWLAGKAL